MTPQPGKYRIVSIATNTPTSVQFFVPHPPPEQSVRLEEGINVWTLTRDIPNFPHVYLFALEPNYPWSGVDSLVAPEKKVAVFAYPGPKAVHWFVKHPEGGPPDVYTIAWDHEHSLLWTVVDPKNPNSDIVLKEPEDGSSRQYFRFEHHK